MFSETNIIRQDQLGAENVLSLILYPGHFD